MLARFLLWALLLAVPLPAISQTAGPPLREEELIVLVRSKMFPDDQIVELLTSRGIGYRLTDAGRRLLKKEGASKTVMEAVERAANEAMRRSSAPPAASTSPASSAVKPADPPKPAVDPPPPLTEEQEKELIDRVRAHALEYIDSLPNFICLQVTRRLVDLHGQGYWQPMDVIQARLAYNEKKESYQVVMVNDRMTDRPMESLGGATSSGEFGSMLRELFLPETAAYFRWVGAATLRGRPVHAFDFRVRKENSRWQILWQRERSILPAYNGRIIVDAETGQILRLWQEAEDIPRDFPIQYAASTLDYDFAMIADRRYLLPSRSVMEMRENKVSTRNEITFRQYRRFSADTKLVFDVADEPPPEEPGKPVVQPPPAPPPKP